MAETTQELIMYKKKDDTTLRVEQPTALLDFIQSKMGGMAKTSVKQLLSQRRVTVNGAVQNSLGSCANSCSCSCSTG